MPSKVLSKGYPWGELQRYRVYALAYVKGFYDYDWLNYCSFLIGRRGHTLASIICCRRWGVSRECKRKGRHSRLVGMRIYLFTRHSE